MGSKKDQLELWDLPIVSKRSTKTHFRVNAVHIYIWQSTRIQIQLDKITQSYLRGAFPSVHCPRETEISWKFHEGALSDG